MRLEWREVVRKEDKAEGEEIREERKYLETLER